MTYTVKRDGQILGTCAVMEQARQAGLGYAKQLQEPVSVTRSDGREVKYHPDGTIEKVWEKRWKLERKLYDLRYDMDCIGCEAEMWEQIHGLDDEELENMIAEYEEEA